MSRTGRLIGGRHCAVSGRARPAQTCTTLCVWCVFIARVSTLRLGQCVCVCVWCVCVCLCVWCWDLHCQCHLAWPGTARRIALQVMYGALGGGAGDAGRHPRPRHARQRRTTRPEPRRATGHSSGEHTAVPQMQHACGFLYVYICVWKPLRAKKHVGSGEAEGGCARGGSPQRGAGYQHAQQLRSSLTSPQRAKAARVGSSHATGRVVIRWSSGVCHVPPYARRKSRKR